MRSGRACSIALGCVVNDHILCPGEEVWFREGCIRNLGTGILPAELGDDVIAVLLRAEPLSFEYLHDGPDLSHVREGRFFDEHGFTLGTVVAHGMLSVHKPHTTPQDEACTIYEWPARSCARSCVLSERNPRIPSCRGRRPAIGMQEGCCRRSGTPQPCPPRSIS